jgi:predicted acetyltransferase
MSELQFRTIAAHERDAVLDLLQEWLNDREFFARYFHHDPAFRDDLCFVATDQGRIVSTFQVFPKQLRVDGAVLQVAGVGNVFTTAAYRERRVASQLLEYGLKAMEEHGFDLSLLFAVRLKFYAALGWCSHTRHLLFIDAASVAADGPYAIRSFSPQDLDQVRAIYDSYNAGFSGPTLRDLPYWQGQLRYAGNPHEDFLVACANDEVVAYARGTTIYGFYAIIEHGCLPAHAAALAQLIRRLHGTEAAAQPGTITQLSIDPGVQEDLRQRGLTLRHVEDVFWMWRIINARQLANKLSLPVDELEAQDFLSRLLPPSASVYWIADRF